MMLTLELNGSRQNEIPLSWQHHKGSTIREITSVTDIVIVSAVCTPVGAFLGGLSGVPAHDLGAAVIKAVLERAGVEPGEVSEVILGQVLTAGQGQNPARQAPINAGLPEEAPPGASTRSAARACGRWRWAPADPLGDAAIVVAGGQESMSQSPHAANLRDGQKMGDLEFVDTMIKDGLWDAFNGYHMGQTAENIARQLADHPRGAGQVRRRLAEQGRGGPEGRPVRGRDRAGDDQRPQGRRRRRHRTNIIRHGATLEALAG